MWRVRHYVLSLAVPNEIAATVGEQAISVDQSLAPAEASSGAPDAVDAEPALAPTEGEPPTV